MKKLTYQEFLQEMYRHNDNVKDRDSDVIKGVIVYTQDSFDRPFTELQRSYEVSSNVWGFMGDKMGHCIIGDCLDGCDNGVRLDWLDWKVEYCYFL